MTDIHARMLAKPAFVVTQIKKNGITAAKQLLIRFPDAQIFGIRIGHRAVHRFGFRSPSVLP
ncbi:MAG: hypothetical protein EWV76_02190 [Microcystis novacekii Mn_MB_F_20050700_S1]|nr:MAG: hypothetical protein EWV76_02190 [Microcystis novacekii Mn_MB_F_20050700_S1]